jgi:hypothetical protein
MANISAIQKNASGNAQSNQSMGILKRRKVMNEILLCKKCGKIYSLSHDGLTCECGMLLQIAKLPIQLELKEEALIAS